jgi:cytochrome c
MESDKNENNRLEIHHKTYKNIFNEKMEDLELLCHSCHQQEHGFAKAENIGFWHRLAVFLFG